MSDDEFEIPLQDQRVFGAGIKRKRVQFVPASTLSSTTKPKKSASANIYLQLVLPEEASSSRDVSTSTDPLSPASLEKASEVPAKECEICHLPLSSQPDPDASDPMEQHPPQKSRPHEASLAHQVCLEHSHPPSNIDRKRKGLAYLKAHGFDPDARLGLGAQVQGTQYPIKVKLKEDKLGVGAEVPTGVVKKAKVEKLDAKKVRKLHERDKRKTDRLREMFYQSENVERYLKGG